MHSWDPASAAADRIPSRTGRSIVSSAELFMVVPSAQVRPWPFNRCTLGVSPGRVSIVATMNVAVFCDPLRAHRSKEARPTPGDSWGWAGGAGPRQSP